MAARATADTRVVIAGGGIGGLAAAAALRSKGIDAIVCEQAPELREIGAGLLLSPNAVRVLDALGLGSIAAQRFRPIREWRILDVGGKLLHRLRAEHRNVPALSLHRADLQFLLREQISPDRLRLGFLVTNFAERRDRIEAVAVSGECVDGDVLVGADGLRSAIREQLLGAESPRYCGYVGWRCVVPQVPRGYEGDWLSESWGEGKRFGITPLAGGRCYWYATANVAGGARTPPSERRTELLRLFGHWHAPIPELIASTPDDAILLNDIFDRAPCGGWTRGRATLLGDAAHPMSPNLGQGACCALEDAWVLARELGRTVPAEWPAALRNYERSRRLRARTVSRASRLLGAVIQLEAPAAIAVSDGLLRLTPEVCSAFTMRRLFAFQV